MWFAESIRKILLKTVFRNEKMRLISNTEKMRKRKKKKWEWSIPNDYYCYFHFLDDETRI